MDKYTKEWFKNLTSDQINRMRHSELQKAIKVGRLLIGSQRSRESKKVDNPYGYMSMTKPNYGKYKGTIYSARNVVNSIANWFQRKITTAEDYTDYEIRMAKKYKVSIEDFRSTINKSEFWETFHKLQENKELTNSTKYSSTRLAEELANYYMEGQSSSLEDLVNNLIDKQHSDYLEQMRRDREHDWWDPTNLVADKLEAQIRQAEELDDLKDDLLPKGLHRTGVHLGPNKRK